jgi:hypothetical protein
MSVQRSSEQDLRGEERLMAVRAGVLAKFEVDEEWDKDPVDSGEEGDDDSGDTAGGESEDDTGVNEGWTDEGAFEVG